MSNKKSQIGIFGFRTVVVWALILMFGIVLFLMTRSAGDTGLTVWESIKKILPFV